MLSTKWLNFFNNQQHIFRRQKRILQFIKGTIHKGLVFQKYVNHTDDSFITFSNSNWVGDPNDWRLTVGAYVFLGGNLIIWVSKKQATVSQSSAKAEYGAIANTTPEIWWCFLILRDLGIRILGAPTIKFDNHSALFLASNSITKVKSRHLEVDYHFVRELYNKGHCNFNMSIRTTKQGISWLKAYPYQNSRSVQI